MLNEIVATLPVLLVVVTLPASAADPPGEIAGDPAEAGLVRVLDPGEPASIEVGSAVYSTQTLAWTKHRFEMARFHATQQDADIGGPALLGLSVGGRAQLQEARAGEEVRQRLASWDGHGAAVLEVFPGSPAYGAGIQPGDVVVQLAGLWVDSHQTLIRMVTRAEPYREIEIWTLRDGQVTSAWVSPTTREELSVPRSGAPPESAWQGTIGLALPRLVESSEPRYPRAALEAGLGGTLSIAVRVDVTGEVEDAQVVQGERRHGLAESALAAVKKRRYEPGELDGRPIDVWMTVVIEYVPPAATEPR